VPPLPPGVQPGMYVCVRTGGWIAWLIRKACRSTTNHALLVADDDGGIIEARPQGVRRGTLSEYAGAYAVANVAEKMTDADRAAVVKFAEGMLNAPYNYAAIASIGLEDMGVRWKWLMRLARADRALICSQLIAEAGNAATPPLPWLCGRASADQVTPADLARRSGVRRVTIS
jgi:uncharacterized protein YycO